MVQTSNEQGCIYVSSSQHGVCVSPEDAGAAAAEIEAYTFHLPVAEMRFPHWVNYVRSQLEAMYDPQTIYRSGFTVYTTLDPDLQRTAEEMVATQVTALADRHVTDGALVAIRPATGEILAMVGSADYANEEIGGQINMAVRPRQPGSSIKPLTYALAFARGWTPATLIWDVPSQFPPSGDPSDTRPPYEPVNYDGRFHGPVTVRTALANSYNVAAVKTLNFVGIYDNPDTPAEEGLIPFARRMGITTLTRPDYGLSLTLGGGEVTLLDLTGAYAVFANGGLRIPPVAITRIVDHTGAEVYSYEVPSGDQVVRPEHAYLISSILSDNAARTPMFGPNSVLNLPFPVAAKTGTTNDFRDNWTLGYTPDLAVGVWVGNADWTPMQNTTGLTGAAPIWNQFMQAAIQRLTGGAPTPFTAPPGIIERVICTISGTEPSDWCTSHRSEIFAADQPPLPSSQDLWRSVWVDGWSLELASGECADFAIEREGLDVTDTWARRWLEEDPQGHEWLEHMGIDRDHLFFIPHTTCSAASPHPILALTSPHEGEVFETPPIEIIGQAAATGNFERWELQYGAGNDPSGWDLIAQGSSPQQDEGRLAFWTPSGAPNGAGTLRLVIFGDHDRRVETRVHIFLALAATPTLTPTPTPTITPTATLPPTPTDTPPPPPTYTPTFTPTATPAPSDTPAPTDTETPTSTPT
jgi:membrane peptidoglycan carboxypeptidase